MGHGGATERMGDFDCGRQQRFVRQTVPESAEREIASHLERDEREERHPLEAVQKPVPPRLIASVTPEEYGEDTSEPHRKLIAGFALGIRKR